MISSRRHRAHRHAHRASHPANAGDRCRVAAGSRGPSRLKLEHFQHTASFKARGAFANLAGRKIPEVGIAAASGGNHGAAAALCRARVRRSGPHLRAASGFAGQGRAHPLLWRGDRSRMARPIMRRSTNAWPMSPQSGALNVHAYDEEPTLLGQGTLGLEIEEQVPDLDTLLVAVGGGGLIGGIAAWFHGKVKIVAVEPETCNSLACGDGGGRTGARDALRHCRRFAWAQASPASSCFRSPRPMSTASHW